ncbi:MAG TPA: DUF4279 domain-containing protein [Planctomycetota bacterium]
MKRPRKAGSRVTVGGPLREAAVSLRVFGDDLRPADLSKRLGCRPTLTCGKGERLPGRRVTARSGMWILESRTRRTLDLGKQIDALLDRVTSDPRVWRKLTARFSVDLYCGLFPSREAQEVWFSPALLTRLAARQLSIGFDLYAPTVQVLSALTTLGKRQPRLIP